MNTTAIQKLCEIAEEHLSSNPDSAGEAALAQVRAFCSAPPVTPGMCTVEPYSGTVVDLAYPKASTIRLDDIAWSLARTGRYNGNTHGSHPYSVAQHSVWMAVVGRRFFGFDDETVLLALLHDGHEAYTGDTVTPVKRLLGLERFHVVEDAIQVCIHDALGIRVPSPAQEAAVKAVDELARLVEIYYLKPSNGRNWPHHYTGLNEIRDTFLKPLPWLFAFRQFLEAYEAVRAGNDLWEFWQDWAPLTERGHVATVE